MILSLIDVAKEKGDTKKVKSYWNVYHCQSKIVSKEQRFQKQNPQRIIINL